MNEKVVSLYPEISTPSERVAKFVRHTRFEIDALMPSSQWEEDTWEAHRGAFLLKGHNRKKVLLHFYNLEAEHSIWHRPKGDPLSQPFKDFAKAYIRYIHATSPVSLGNTRKRSLALRCIEAAFRTLGHTSVIENLSVVVLNKAVELAGKDVTPTRHYQIASDIQQIYKFCMEWRLLNGPCQWKHAVRRQSPMSQKLDEEAKEWREKKLPSPEAYYALAHIYRNSETFLDRLLSAVTAICVSVPIRAHEVLQLRVDCEVYGETESETGETVKAYGIRVWPGKGNPPQVKWVPSQLVSLVKEAVARLREMCASAREVAKWYEANPGSLWLPTDTEHCRASGWIPGEVVERLVSATSEPIRKWMRKRNIRMNERDDAALTSLEAFLLPLLPLNFPNFNAQGDQLYSETLIVMHYRQNQQMRRTIHAIVEQVTVQVFEHWLSGHDNGKLPSVFHRWRFKEKDGSDIRITTHAFRHWLNTVAQFKGMSQLDIAKWSGRDIEQNSAYNHVTDDEMLSRIRSALDDGTASGPMFEAALVQGVQPPVDRREFINAQIGAALATDFGFCVHDYSLLPCQTYGDCLGCSENVFVKGDAKHRLKVERRLALADNLLAQATTAMHEGVYGADKWVSAHSRACERMRLMLSIHDDPSIPDGTIINLPDGAQDSETAMAIRDREAKDAALLPAEAPVEEHDVEELAAVLSVGWEEQ